MYRDLIYQDQPEERSDQEDPREEERMLLNKMMKSY